LSGSPPFTPRTIVENTWNIKKIFKTNTISAQLYRRMVDDRGLVMQGINKVLLVGYIGNDPEFRNLADNVAVLKFYLATNETVNDDEQFKATEWHNIIMWREIAKNAAEVLKKGDLIYLEGELSTRSFTNKVGVKNYATDVVASRFQVLS